MHGAEKSGLQKTPGKCENLPKSDGLFVDSFARITISCHESIAIERDRICCHLMFGCKSHDLTAAHHDSITARHDSTAAHSEPRCEGARSGRREHLPFCRWAARRALCQRQWLETRINLTRAVESWYRAVEAWVRFKVFFR